MIGLPRIVWLPLAASLTMVATDILGVLLSQAENRRHANLAGVLDAAGWLVSIFTTAWALEGIDSRNWHLKVAVLASVTVANYVGSWLGTTIGDRLMGVTGPTVDARLAALETRLGLQPAGPRVPALARRWRLPHPHRRKGP